MAFGSLVHAAVEVLLPSLCVACGSPLPGGSRTICPGCWQRLGPVAGPRCPRCGGPSDSDVEPCLGCATSPPPQLGTVIWGEHEGVLRRLLLALKLSGHDELVAPLGQRLAAVVERAPWAASVELVASVPSHPLRRLRRGPAAAGLLAHEVARRLGLVTVRALVRRGLGRQAGRTRVRRLRLAAGSFSTRGVGVRGRRVLLVDDVTTTGTTLQVATRALVAAGAREVYCAALARAPESRRVR